MVLHLMHILHCQQAIHISHYLRHLSANSSDTLNHLEYVPPKHVFSNTSKIDTVYNANNRSWQGIHDSIIMAKNRELFETVFIAQDEHPQVDSTRVNIQV